MKNLRGRIVEVSREVRASYWFIPSLMAVAAIILSQSAIQVDESLGRDWLAGWDFLYANKPEGARALLSTIAGSMIGVAGVTFSITIAAVAYASSQFGPRIIDNFMRDTGNQVTLGTFIATFIYCLLVLRIVRNGEEAGGFVPHAAVFIGVLLALASLVVLIYFIHHIPESIHVSKLVARVGEQFRAKIDSIYPEDLGESLEDLPRSEFPVDPKGPSFSVRSTRDGHVQSVDSETLMTLSEKDGLVIVLEAEPGDFVVEAQLLARIYGESENSKPEDLQAAFVIGNERSPTQDVLYLSDQLIDIAGRALSPGINDPQTAIGCINWLNVGLARLGRRSFPSRIRLNKDGTPALITSERGFTYYVDNIYDQLRPYVEKDRNAGLHMLKRSLETLETLPVAHRRCLYNAVQRLIEGCLRHFDHSRDRQLLHALQVRLGELSTGNQLLRDAARESGALPSSSSASDLTRVPATG